jgi:hypothetical protein
MKKKIDHIFSVFLLMKKKKKKQINRNIKKYKLSNT